MNKIIVFCILLQVFIANATFYSDLKLLRKIMDSASKNLDEIVNESQGHLTAVQLKLEKEANVNVDIYDATCDIENMVKAMEMEGKNVTGCLEWGKRVCRIAGVKYNTHLGECYHQQMEIMNRTVSPLQRARIDLFSMIEKNEKMCAPENFYFKSITSRVCYTYSLVGSRSDVHSFENSVNELKNKAKIRFSLTNLENLMNKCYNRALLALKLALDEEARLLTEECIELRTGDKPTLQPL